MKLTLKENININSLTLQHNILLQATTLLQGREGALETEKKIFLLLAVVDTIIEEDLLQLCNEDSRLLTDILMEDIEPFIEHLKEQDDSYTIVINYLTDVYLKHCDKIWAEQHSIIGVIEALLTMIGSMSDEERKEALVATSKIAEEAFDRRTEKMEKQTIEANSKLEKLVQQYQRMNDIKQESDTE